MDIADLTREHQQTVWVVVPDRLKAMRKKGKVARGTVRGQVRNGYLARVSVAVEGHKTLTFRPQDLYTTRKEAERAKKRREQAGRRRAA